MSKLSKTPLNPQPFPNSLLILKRFYTVLKRDKEYKKGVSWIEQIPDDIRPKQSNIALVEYCGVFPDAISVHGNSKNTCNSEIVRTSASTMTRIRDKVAAKMPPRQIYAEMSYMDAPDAPRDTKQVRNKKYSTSKSLQMCSIEGQVYRPNTADDVQYLISQVQTSPIIQEMIQMKDNTPPCEILYKNEQLNDLKQCCGAKCKLPTTVGVDRTFNVSACYLTLLVYKNPRLLQKCTQEPPILLGPSYLHWNGMYQTYHKCDVCENWYHPKCVNISKEEVMASQNVEWKCPECRKDVYVESDPKV